FHGDDKTSAFKLRASRSTQTDRPLREHCDSISDLDLSAFRRRNSGGGNVSEQDDLFIRQIVGNLSQIRLRVRHQEILRLSAIDSVSEFPPPNRTAALRPFAAQAIVALPARRNRTHEDAVSYRIAGKTDTHLVDHPNRFMPYDQARLHGIFALQYVQIGS